jgi:hypothetical protein
VRIFPQFRSARRPRGLNRLGGLHNVARGVRPVGRSFPDVARFAHGRGLRRRGFARVFGLRRARLPEVTRGQSHAGRVVFPVPPRGRNGGRSVRTEYRLCSLCASSVGTKPARTSLQCALRAELPLHAIRRHRSPRSPHTRCTPRTRGLRSTPRASHQRVRGDRTTSSRVKSPAGADMGRAAQGPRERTREHGDFAHIEVMARA